MHLYSKNYKKNKSRNIKLKFDESFSSMRNSRNFILSYICLIIQTFSLTVHA